MLLKEFLKPYVDEKNASLEDQISKLKEMNAPEFIIERYMKNLSTFPGAKKFNKFMNKEIIRTEKIDYKYFPKGFPKKTKAFKILMDEAVLVFIPECHTLATYNSEYLF